MYWWILKWKFRFFSHKILFSVRNARFIQRIYDFRLILLLCSGELKSKKVQYREAWNKSFKNFFFQTEWLRKSLWSEEKNPKNIDFRLWGNCGTTCSHVCYYYLILYYLYSLTKEQFLIHPFSICASLRSTVNTCIKNCSIVKQ